MGEHAREKVDLTQLTGLQMDTRAYQDRRRQLLEIRGWTWESYAARQLALHAPLIAKIAKHGPRTPAAQHLPKIASLLDTVTHQSDAPPDTEKISELLAHFEYQVEEAEDHFGG